MLGLLIIGYALSPIDLIPDFIPVIGYLDELILIPVGLWMLLKLIPEQVLYESREKAEELQDKVTKEWDAMAGEWDDNAVATFKLNFPDVPVFHGDIDLAVLDLQVNNLTTDLLIQRLGKDWHAEPDSDGY